MGYSENNRAFPQSAGDSKQLAKDVLSWMFSNVRSLYTVSAQTKKREYYLDHSEYYMALALLAQERSKDPKYQVGASIVNPEGFVVGLGYNGAPVGYNDNLFPWDKDEKAYYVCHAELNAIIFKFQGNIKGSTMYVTRFPCHECTKLIIQSGIKEVVYLRKKENSTHDNIKASEEMMDAVNIKYRKYEVKREKVLLDFTIA